MGFIGEGVDASGIDPAVVEVEEGDDGDRVVDLLVAPAGRVQRGDVGFVDLVGVGVYYIEEMEEEFLRCGQRGAIDVG